LLTLLIFTCASIQICNILVLTVCYKVINWYPKYHFLQFLGTLLFHTIHWIHNNSLNTLWNKPTGWSKHIWESPHLLEQSVTLHITWPLPQTPQLSEKYMNKKCLTLSTIIRQPPSPFIWRIRKTLLFLYSCKYSTY
jgi:hypothetical protein